MIWYVSTCFPTLATHPCWQSNHLQCQYLFHSTLLAHLSLVPSDLQCQRGNLYKPNYPQDNLQQRHGTSTHVVQCCIFSHLKILYSQMHINDCQPLMLSMDMESGIQSKPKFLETGGLGYFRGSLKCCFVS